MAAEARISVVIPTHDDEPYLAECLTSVLRQSRAPFEVLVCDDASTDRTREIALRFSRRSGIPVRSVFHAEHVGVVANFNSGLEAARGDLVSLVAGDDLWAPDKLAREAAQMHRTGAGWAYSRVGVLDQTSRQLTPSFWGTDRCLEGNVLLPVLGRQMSPRSPLIETTALRRIGLFDPQFALFEDWDLKIRLAAELSIAHVPAVQVIYRRHGAGLSNRPLLFRLRQAAAVVERHAGRIEALGAETAAQVRASVAEYFARAVKNEARRQPEPRREDLEVAIRILQRIQDPRGTARSLS